MHIIIAQLRRCILYGDVAACHEMACVLSHLLTIYDDVILLNVLTEV